MSLDLAKLEKVRELADGIVQARCPACAEGGSDRKGEHLRVFADGRFGCAVFPKDAAHRKRIFALAGDKAPKGQFTVRASCVLPVTTAGRSVRDSLRGFRGTPGTAISESVLVVPSVPAAEMADEPKSWDAWDGSFQPTRAYAREEIAVVDGEKVEKLKESESPVPSVPRIDGVPRPYLTTGGTLVIPFDSPERFHWWKGGQSLAITRAEVEARMRESAGKEQNGAGV